MSVWFHALELYRCRELTDNSVEDYDTSTATLILFHNAPSSPPQIRAKVNVDLLVSSLKQEDTTVGEWLNVIGYVNDHQNFNTENQVARSVELVEVKIQAIMIWSAGSVKLADYERALQQREDLITNSEYKK